MEETPQEDLVIMCSVSNSLNVQNDWVRAGEIVVVINEYRSFVGLDALHFNKGMAAELALDHNVYMIDQGRISHDNFIQRATILSDAGAQAVGENVAFGYTSPEELVNAWINSISHREVLEGNYTDAAIAVSKDLYGTEFVTMLVTR